VAVKAAHFARPPGLGLDGREHGDNIRVRRGSEYSIRTLQNADEKHGASTDFFNRCTWYLIPSSDKAKQIPAAVTQDVIASLLQAGVKLPLATAQVLEAVGTERESALEQAAQFTANLHRLKAILRKHVVILDEGANCRSRS
jgi:hypothetical protein